MSNTPAPASKPINRSDLARLVDNLGNEKQTHERHVAEIDRMMVDLAKQRETAARNVFEAETRRQAVRLAIRHMEDKGVL